MTQVQLSGILPPNYAATKAEGEWLIQRAQNALKNSKRNALTRRKKPFLQDTLNTLHIALNKFIDQYANIKFLQEFIGQLKFVRANVKRRMVDLLLCN